MDPQGVAQLTDILQTAGGWGTTVIFLLLFLRERRAAEAKDERIFTLLDKQTDILKLLDRIDRG